MTISITPYSEITEQMNTEILFLLVTTDLTFTIQIISSQRVKANKIKCEGFILLFSLF